MELEVNSPDRTWPHVSVVMAVRNEARDLQPTVDAVLSQDYPGVLDITIAAAQSDDDTTAVLEAIAKDERVTVIDNPAGITPTGLNAAISASLGEVVVRVDGRAVIPPGYVRRAVELLDETGADNVGGIMDAQGRTPFERAVAAAMSSRFGTGDAKFHYGGSPGPVDTVYLGSFRRA
ncbi:MAG TPA: glycosyltransferase, partial [Euzebyales bacterium]|nr:glycosyltransferase [Euzebyales bacterium]